MSPMSRTASSTVDLQLGHEQGPGFRWACGHDVVVDRRAGAVPAWCSPMSGYVRPRAVPCPARHSHTISVRVRRCGNLRTRCRATVGRTAQRSGRPALRTPGHHRCPRTARSGRGLGCTGRQLERRHRRRAKVRIGYRTPPRPRPGAGRRDHRIVPQGGDRVTDVGSDDLAPTALGKRADALLISSGSGFAATGAASPIRDSYPATCRRPR